MTFPSAGAISMTDAPTISQDACQGVDLDLDFSA
jgi:hypothetical protein